MIDLPALRSWLSTTETVGDRTGMMWVPRHVLEPLVAIAEAAFAWMEADAAHETTECTCGGEASCDAVCPATAAIDRFELGRARLIAAIDSARGAK